MFKRGQTFNGGLTFNNETGTADNRITVGAYGVGDKPILDGQGARINILLQNAASYITVKDLALHRGVFNNIVANGSGTFYDLIFQNLDLTSEIDSSYSFYLIGQTDNLTISDITMERDIFLGVNDNATFENIVINDAYNGLWTMSDSNDLTLKNVLINSPTNNGLKFSSNKTATNLTIDGLTITNLGNRGIDAENYTISNSNLKNIKITGGDIGFFANNISDTLIENIEVSSTTNTNSELGAIFFGGAQDLTVTNATTTDNTGIGIQVKPGASNTAITLNNLYSAYNSTGIARRGTACYSLALNNSRLEHNTSYGLYSNAPGTTTISGTNFSNNRDGFGGWSNLGCPSFVSVDKSIFEGNTSNGILFNSISGIVTRSLFKSNGTAFLESGSPVNDIDIKMIGNIFDSNNSSVTNLFSSLYFLHNTILKSPVLGTAMFLVGSSTISNNIISGYENGINLNSGTITAENNLISAPTPATGFTLDSSNIITANPRLNSDYSLKDNSLAIDAALPLPTYKRDFFGKPLYGAPDIGAIEWQPLYQDDNPAKTQVSQEVFTEISVTFPTSTKRMSKSIRGLTGGNSQGFTGDFYIKTNNPSGYTATLNFSSTTAMQRVGGGGFINNYIPVNPAVPDMWPVLATSSHWFGYKILSAHSKDYLNPLFKTDLISGVCNTGWDAFIGVCWYNQADATVPVTIMSRNTKTPASGDDFHVEFRVSVAEDPTPALPEGIYQATMTITILPN